VTTPESRGSEPGVRSDVPGARVTGTGPATPSSGTPAPAAAAAPTPSAPAPAARPAAPARSGKRGAGRSIGLGLAAALLVFVTVLLVLFIVFNTQTVQISLVFGDVQAPLVLALLIAAGLGGLLVSLVGAVLRARRSRS
jgi:uncharacterized integral membrane protein